MTESRQNLINSPREHLQKRRNVFTVDFLEMWIETKRKESDALRLRPHPYEFHLYYDV